MLDRSADSVDSVDRHAHPAGCLAERRCTTLMLCGVVLFLWLAPRLAQPLTPRTPPLPIVSTINPNDAPWWELASLPDVGESLARAIVKHRDATRGASGATASPAFTCLKDLDTVPGIGPKTLQRLSPYLRFAD